MSEVWKSCTYSSQMRLLGETPYIYIVNTNCDVYEAAWSLTITTPIYSNLGTCMHPSICLVRITHEWPQTCLSAAAIRHQTKPSPRHHLRQLSQTCQRWLTIKCLLLDLLPPFLILMLPLDIFPRTLLCFNVRFNSVKHCLHICLSVNVRQTGIRCWIFALK